MDRKRLVDSLVLRAARGVGDRGFRHLVDALGSPGAVLDADPATLVERCGASEALVASIAACRGLEGPARSTLERLGEAGFATVAYGQDGYPECLAAIPDPPAVLHLAGAPLVQLGTINFKQPAAGYLIRKDLADYCRKHNISNLIDIVGKLKI